MNKEFWRQFPLIDGFHCLDMKDHVQTKVAEETRRISPVGLIAYFREASRRLWQDMGRPYPEHNATPLAVREKPDGKDDG